MIGIYKITSPSKRIYIGQSIDIEKRFNTYKRLDCKSQTILYRSLLKHGVNKHKFEILCECEVNELNDKERYYQDVFSAIGKNGLNCSLTKSTDRSGKLSEETCKKIIKSLKGNKRFLGKKHTNEAKIKISESSKGNKHNLGKKLSEETKLKMSESLKGNTNSLGFKHSEETREKMSKAKSKIILNLETGIIYLGCEEAANSIGINRSTLINYLCGNNKNKTSFIYV